MAMTKSRKAPRSSTKSAASALRHVPDMDTLVDGAAADRFTEEWIAKLRGKKASSADYAIHVECGGLRFQFNALIPHLFERVAQLEADLRAARDEIKRYATRDGLEWMRPIPRSKGRSGK